MSDLIPVRLLKRHTLYNEGEVAGFPPGVAAQLIAQGRAEAFEAIDQTQELTGDGSGEPLPPIDVADLPPAPTGEEGGEGDAGEGEGEKAPTGDGTTPPADKTPKPKGKK